jgi:hypothetical protein
LLINLYGPPGCGKSTTRAGVFYHLKQAGVNCEEVTEFAKKLVWEHRGKTLECQPYVFGKQLRDIEVLKGQVAAIITDSPLLLSKFYGEKYCGDRYPASFYDYVVDQARLHGGMNILLRRVKPYNPKGRNQTADESDAFGADLKAMLDGLGVDYIELDGDKEAAEKIATMALAQMSEQR